MRCCPNIAVCIERHSFAAVVIVISTTIICGLTGAVARADTIAVTAVTNVLYGTANLNSSLGAALKNVFSAETLKNTGFFTSTLQPLTFAQYQGVMTSAFAASLGSNLAGQLAADPQTQLNLSFCMSLSLCGPPLPTDTPIPAFVLNGLINSANANILGLNAGVGVTISPDPAMVAFNTMLTTQPVPLGITSDTGLFVVDPDIAFTYAVDLTLANGPFAGDQFEILDNFNFYERNVTEQIGAETPVPPSWTMLLAGLAGFGVLFGRKSRVAPAAG